MDDTRFCAADWIDLQFKQTTNTVVDYVFGHCDKLRVQQGRILLFQNRTAKLAKRPFAACHSENAVQYNKVQPAAAKLHVVSMYERTTPAVPSGLALEIGLFCRKSVHSLLTMSVSLPIERKHFGNSKQGQYGNRFGVNDGGRLFDKCEIFWSSGRISHAFGRCNTFLLVVLIRRLYPVYKVYYTKFSLARWAWVSR